MTTRLSYINDIDTTYAEPTAATCDKCELHCDIDSRECLTPTRDDMHDAMYLMLFPFDLVNDDQLRMLLEPYYNRLTAVN
ncbi:MAG: hypothetical protein LBN02_00525 [Oscillospiraceae bacterium]|jgi:hypothetical protein|nr:hypothetical protein [Oscillospiraceae bacterium]